MPTKEKIAERFKALQNHICNELEKTDGKGQFKEDNWSRPGGGGGRTRILTKGSIIEKGGVNFSAVEGKTPKKILKAFNLDESDFFATGVSIVIHPFNPFVPIIHMNVRYFEMANGIWWFGGGIDLTPHYINKEDAQYFHHKLKSVCDKHDPSYYNKFKKWADDYFYIQHRDETRGIGGIFFDRLDSNTGKSKAELFDFIDAVASEFAPTYTHFLRKNSDTDFTENNKQWQKLRRGRYVEFNLVWDKGTKFGLETNGRTESILMSLPPEANWAYDYQPESGSEEEKTQQLLKKNIDWVKYSK